MAATVYQLASTAEQIDMLDPAATLQFIAVAATDEADARVAVNAASPAVYYGLSKRSIQMSEQGGGVWLGDVEYKLLEGSPIDGFTGTRVPTPGVPFPPPGSPGGPPAPPNRKDDLDETYSFQTGGGTRHVTQSIHTVTRVKRGGGIAEHQRETIGARPGQDPTGCDIYVAQLQFDMVKEVHGVSLEYVLTLEYLTGTVNAQEFYYHKPGEVLFLGATGRKKGPAEVGGWVVTYQFAVSPNLEFQGDRTSITDPLVIVKDSAFGANDGLIVEEKDGWDYLWVLYETVEPDTAAGEKHMKQVARAAYVERVYQRKDFNLLGIG